MLTSKNILSLLALLVAALSINIIAQGLETTNENSEQLQHLGQTGYTSEINNEIKALPEANVTQLLKGQGTGLAKAAELNSYPGPKHVLEFQSELDLTDKQVRQTKELIEPMKTEAIKLGKQIIAKEKELDLVFKNKVANVNLINEKIMEIAKLYGQLRYVHLSTHLSQREIMTDEQIIRYNHLRGYN